jgi:hypothetical protein
MEKLIKLGLIGIVLALLGYATGRYFQPAKVEIRTEEKVRTVLIETVKKKRIKIKIIRPDGTIEEKEIEEDITINEKDKSKDTKTEKIVTNSKAQWRASLLAGKRDGIDLTLPMYGVSIEKRLIGPTFVGVWATNKKDFGISIGLEF